MDVFYGYTYGTAGWLSMQALPLLLSPGIIVTLLSTETRKATDLEIYFSRSLALALLTLALLTVLLTGSIPLTSSIADSQDSDSNTEAPYALPTLLLTTLFHTSCAFYSYAQYTATSQTGFALSVTGYGALAAMGGWCLMFGTEKGRISRRTGADKRVSGWPFRNMESEKKRGKKRL